ncbi:non-LTR retrotransposon transposase [Gossypium australe]|uniref:Non-LTR retrotransposon transposase n=1 Tax=Gossypium australe TaxID=47621 RepID=A0A5B6WX31_9ROSI|nr:non-LTR retrotransposon transposase [Gossypium australe]
MLWKIPGPQRVKHFIWVIIKKRLLTNSERVRRGIAQDATCHLCGHIKEDTLHVLRDCPFAREIWHNIIPANHLGSFFFEWLFSNLQFFSTNKLGDSSWACLFWDHSLAHMEES